MTVPPEIASMSFEEALAELEKIVRELESGQSKLDEAIQAYERGSHLKAHCEAKLRDAQMKVERITRAADGSLSLAPARLD
jgi:exodeoxyribonuclease VII small subunit